MADVEAIFGAQIDKLLTGVETTKRAIESISESANKVTETFKRMGEAFGIALTIEGVKTFIESMAALGLETERAQAQLGATAEQIQFLSGIAKLTGGSLEGMVMSMERLHIGMQRATRDGFSPQAEAMKVLHIQTKDFIGLNPQDEFIKLADAVSKFNPSMNLASALIQLGGRGMIQALPAFLLGGKHMRELAEASKAAAADFAVFAPKAAETHQKLTLLGMAMTGLGERIFMVVKPAIDAAADALRTWVQSIDAKTIAGIVGTIGDAVLTILQTIGHLVLTVSGWIDQLGSKSASFADKAKNFAKGSITGLLSPIPFGGILGGLGGAALTGGGGGGGSPADQSRIEREKFDAQIEAWRVSWAKMTQTMMKGAEDVSHAVGTKLDAKAVQQDGRQQVEAMQANIEQQIIMAKGLLEQKKIIYDQDAALFRITENEKTRLTIAASNQAYQSEMEALLRIQQLWKGHAKEWEEIQKKIVALQQQHSIELMRINAESLKSMQATWETWISGISSSFTGQIRGLIQGTTTWKQAFKNSLLDMTIFFIQQIEKMVVKWAAGQLAMLTATQATEVGKTAATIAGEEAGLPVQIGHFVSSILADSALVFAGVFANLAPLMGPAAAGPAGVAQGAVLAELANVPKFEMGTPFVPNTGLAIVHQGERIVPAAENAAGFGSPQVSVQISAWDGRSVQQWLKSGGAGMLARALADHYSSNPTSRGKY